jgi:hypothetical protein
MTSYPNSFSFVLPNFMNLRSNAGGQLEYNFGLNLAIPPIQGFEGLPNNLKDLIELVGQNNININYSIAGTGTVPGHSCNCTHYQYATLYVGTGGQPTRVTLWNDIGKGGRSWTIDPNAWISVSSNAQSAPWKIVTQADRSGQCGTAFCPGNDNSEVWGGISLSLKTDVTINTLGFCLAPGTNNIRQPFCMNRIGDILSRNEAGAQVATTFLQQDYCKRRFPDGLLQNITNPPPGTVDDIDTKLCACNMPNDSYNALAASISTNANISIGSVRPQCLLSQCLASSFKGNNIDRCPGAQCVNVTSLNGNSITGSVTVTQNSECASAQVTNNGGSGTGGTGTGGTGTGGTGGTGTGGTGTGGTGGTGGTDTQTTTSSIRWGWIILGIVLLVLLIVFIYMFVNRGSKTTPKVTTPKVTPDYANALTPI